MSDREGEDLDNGDNRSRGPEDGHYELPQSFHGRRWTNDEILTRARSLASETRAASEATGLASPHRVAIDVDEILSQIKSQQGFLGDARHAAGPFERTVADMEHLQGVLREIIAQRSRPHLRPLRLRDLPSEILSEIVAHCERGARADQDLDAAATASPRAAEDLATIRNLRLTCRELADLAAPYLVRFADVDMSPASLARLDAVSRHPTISKGVLCVRVGLASYPARLKTSFGDFARLARRALFIEARRGNRAGGLCAKDRGRYRARVQEWMRDAEPPLLVRAHAEYVRRCGEYEAVRAGFGEVVGEAVARMRNATSVEVNDKPAQDPGGEWWGKYGPRPENDFLVDEEALLELVTSPMRWEQAAGYEWSEASDHPVEALRELLGALGHRGVRITRLEVSLTPPAQYNRLECTGIERDDIITAVQGMRSAVFEVKPRDHFRLPDLDPPAWPPRGPEELECLGAFLSAALASESLESLILDFDALRRENQDLWTLNTLLRSAPQGWQRLNRLTLRDACLSASDLDVLVGERVERFTLHTPHLTEGSWAEVLETLHRRADRRRGERGEVPMQMDSLSRPTGGEAEAMTSEQYDAVFSQPKGWDSYEARADDDRWLSPAMRYVRHLQHENPLHEAL